MAEDAAETRGEERSAHRDAKAELDERKIARGAAIGLPLVTVTLSLVCGVLLGAPMAILVLAAGMLLGVIGLFWASLRILSGDAALSPELEALDATAHAVDALATRKKMLVRALKDLDNERALGKLDDEDYEDLSTKYRNELKDVLTLIDATLAPHRPRAEDAARAYLGKAGLAEEGYRGAPPPPSVPAAEESDESLEDVAKAEKKPAKSPRVECTSCKTSNEPDATFCKKCGASLAAKTSDDDDDDSDDSDDANDGKPAKETADEA